MPKKKSTPVKAIKRPTLAAKPAAMKSSKTAAPAAMKSAKLDKVTDMKPSEQRRKAEEAKQKADAPPPHAHDENCDHD